MTPKEKAFDLISKFQHPLSEESDTDCLHIEVAKEFALITTNEVINTIMSVYQPITKEFWFEVKKEIEKL